MGRDRAAILTVRAAVRGVLDFRRADLRDPAWWRRSRLVLEAMAQEDALVCARANLDFQLAILGNGSLTRESFDQGKERAGALIDALDRLVRPWLDPTQAASSTVAALVEQYHREIGDPRDPAFLAAVAASVERSREERRRLREQAGRAMTEEERMEERRRARDRRARAGSR